MRPGFIAAALVIVGRSIPQDTWRRARCVAVIPGAKKGALVVGGEYGEGLVSCRTPNGWSAPAYLALHEGSLGAQIGVESVDLYGRTITAREILTGGRVATPSATQPFVAALK